MPLEHTDKVVFIFGIFQFFLCLNWYYLGVDISCYHSHTDKTQVPHYNFIGVVFEIPGAHPRPLLYRGLARTNFDVIFGEEKKVSSASCS